jgi:hypothetical protein
VSNRGKIRPRTPPAEVADYARAFRCSDCASETARPRYRRGLWLLDVRHDRACPLLNGEVTSLAAHRAAGEAVRSARGRPVAVVTIPATRNRR